MQSMTGFGRGVVCRDGREVVVELKSVNHRFLDISVRAPRVFLFAEDAIKKEISGFFARGHIDVFVICGKIHAQWPLMRVYYRNI